MCPGFWVAADALDGFIHRVFSCQSLELVADSLTRMFKLSSV